MTADITAVAPQAPAQHRRAQHDAAGDRPVPQHAHGAHAVADAAGPRHLHSLPVDALKIDGSFVRRMVDDPVNRELIRAIQQVGKVLSIRTIAESVENEETLDAVREIGVDYAQGYWLDRPRPLAPNAQ